VLIEKPDWLEPMLKEYGKTKQNLFKTEEELLKLKLQRQLA
jgi:hypothetical protein